MANKTSLNDVNSRMAEILRSAKDKLGGSLSLFLIDREDGQILIQYPQEESKNYEYVGIVCGANIQGFENKAAQMNEELFIEEMEIKTGNEILIYVYRITKSLVLCIVAEKGFSAGFARRLCQGSLKEEIKIVLDRMGLSTI